MYINLKLLVTGYWLKYAAFSKTDLNCENAFVRFFRQCFHIVIHEVR